MSQNHLEVWIGLVEFRVAHDSNPFGSGIAGAAVNAVAMADSAAQFKARINTWAIDNGLEVDAYEDVEKLSSRLLKWTIDPSIEEAVSRLQPDSPVGFGVFHTYESE